MKTNHRQIMFPSKSLQIVLLAVLLPLATQRSGVSQDRVSDVRATLVNEIELETLATFVSQRLNLNIIYDKKKLENKKVTLKAPSQIPDDQLVSLLQSALRTHNLILVDDEAPGFRRIVDKSEAASYAASGESIDQIEKTFGAPTYSSHTFLLKHVSPTSIKPLVEFLISKDAPRPTVFESQNAIAVTARTTELRKIEELLRQVDMPQQAFEYSFYTAKNLKSENLKTKVEELLAAQTEIPTADGVSAKVFDVDRTNQLAIIGPKELVKKALELAGRLDVSLGQKTKAYTLKFVSARRIEELMKKLLKTNPGTPEYESTTDEESNLLIVTATAETHQRIEELIREMDTETKKEKSPIRFYKLQNISAVQALETIRALQGLSYGPVLGSSGQGYSPRRDTQYEGFPNRNNPPFGPGFNDGFNGGFGNPFNNGFNSGFGNPFPGGGNPGMGNQGMGNQGGPFGSNQQSTRQQQESHVATPRQGVAPYSGKSGNMGPIDAPKVVHEDWSMIGLASYQEAIPATQGNAAANPLNSANASGSPNARAQAAAPLADAQRLSPTGTSANASAASTIFSQELAQVTADTNTNSLIVVADAATQRVYEELIKKIDRRSPQVLIEAKIVTIDTTNQFSLGVEISGGDREGSKKVFGFSRFGLSDVDADTGALTIIPGLGFNGTLIDPEVADVIVRALSSHTRAKVVASPRILVNENAEGVIESVVSVPFQSVNANNAISTTTLGGNQEAGTKISVIPHISEGDHLELNFSIEFSSFQDGGTTGLPPPRQINSIQSVATIPDGHTVIVGGLNREDQSGTLTTIPLIEHIPVLRELVKNESKRNQNAALFIFIRPVILRDDKFKNLRFLSDRAELQSGTKLPMSTPVMIE